LPTTRSAPKGPPRTPSAPSSIRWGSTASKSSSHAVTRLAHLIRPQAQCRTQRRSRAQRPFYDRDCGARRFDRLATAVVPIFRRPYGPQGGRQCARRHAAANGTASTPTCNALEMRKSTIWAATTSTRSSPNCRTAARRRRSGGRRTHPDRRCARSRTKRRSVGEQLRAARDTFSAPQRRAARHPSSGCRSPRSSTSNLRARSRDRADRSFRTRPLRSPKSTLEQRTSEAHQAFARRLEDYAAATLGTDHRRRYAEIFRPIRPL